MNITKTVNGSEATLALEGWLDTQASPELHAALEDLGDDVSSLIFDL